MKSPLSPAFATASTRSVATPAATCRQERCVAELSPGSFDAVLGTRRGALRRYDALLAGEPVDRARAECAELEAQLDHGETEAALRVLSDSRGRLSSETAVRVRDAVCEYEAYQAGQRWWFTLADAAKLLGVSREGRSGAALAGSNSPLSTAVQRELDVSCLERLRAFVDGDLRARVELDEGRLAQNGDAALQVAARLALARALQREGADAVRRLLDDRLPERLARRLAGRPETVWEELADALCEHEWEVLVQAAVAGRPLSRQEWQLVVTDARRRGLGERLASLLVEALDRGAR